MKIKVRFLTSVQDITGLEMDEIQSQNIIDVEELLALLSKKHSRRFSEYIYDKRDNLQKYIQILINGVDIKVLQGLDTKLKDGDIVAVSAAVGGGIHL